MTDLTYTNSQDSLIAGYHWDYDADSRVSDMYSRNDTTGTPGGSYTGWAETSYSYDHDSQLTTTNYNSNFANPPTTSTSETYDPNGNRESTNVVTEASSTNRLLFDGQYYYSYDPAGNRTAKFESATGQLDSTATNITTYQWNNANELTGVSECATYAAYKSGTATSQVAYGYDPFGGLVSRTPAGGTAEYFVNDGQNVALVLNSIGQVTERELWGPAVDQILATEEVTALSGGGAQSAGTVNWDLTDNQGTVRDVVQYNGGATSVVNHLVYDSFGQITSQTPGAAQPTFTYTGMWQDPTTRKLDKAALRWYDTVDGVFGSQDPLGFGGGQTNTSEYCGNSPTNATDPTGEFGWGLATTIGGAAYRRCH